MRRPSNEPSSKPGVGANENDTSCQVEKFIMHGAERAEHGHGLAHVAMNSAVPCDCSA